MYRQGDVLLIDVDTAPEQATAVARDQGRIILAYGEVTGHAHAIATKAVKMVQVGDDRYLIAAKPFTVTHEEHAPVKVPAGTFKVVIQREYHPSELRRVID